MNRRLYLRMGFILLLLAVMIGAFGAHGIKNLVGEAQIKTFETGVRYQFYHAFGILILQFIPSGIRYVNRLKWAARFFLVGIIFFSGSLYLLALAEPLGISSWSKLLGPITPIGGVCFIFGWTLAALGLKGRK